MRETTLKRIQVFSIVIGLLVIAILFTFNKSYALPEELINISILEVLDNEYNDLTSDFVLTKGNDTLEDLNVYSGTKLMDFSLSSNKEFDDVEITFNVSGTAIKNEDVLAMYKYNDDDSSWHVVDFYEVYNDKFIMETEELGRFAIVNKSYGEKNPNEIMTLDRSTNYNFRDKLIAGGIYTSDTEIVVNHYWSEEYSKYVEFIGVNFKRDETASGEFNFEAQDDDIDVLFYFEDCVFDGLSLSFQHRGYYVFNNCTFINSPITSIELMAQNVNVYVYNSHMHDNNPSLDGWNGKESNRAWKYAAINIRSKHCSVHVLNSLIENYMSHVAVRNSASIGARLYFEYSMIRNTEGQGIGMYETTKGRVDNSVFRDIGALRGITDYEVSYNEEHGGSGVGGNPIFGLMDSYEMRVFGNDIKNVMENGIEGFYYSVTNNIVDTTGYRVEDGHYTVSTEGIWGGSWLVKNNVVKNVYGKGIVIENWKNHPVEVSNNTIIKGDRNVTLDEEGIRIHITDSSEENSYKNVVVKNNIISGFINNYRVLNTKFKRGENIVIYDSNPGRFINATHSSLKGLNIISTRQNELEFQDNHFEEINDNKLTKWDQGNFKIQETGEVENESYVRLKAKNTYGASLTQTFDLPVPTSMVCLTVKVRPISGDFSFFVKSTDDNGDSYPSGDGGVYSSYKIQLTDLNTDEFNTYSTCFKAKNHSQVGIYLENEKEIEIMSMEGHYFVNDTKDIPIENNDDTNDDENNTEGLLSFEFDLDYNEFLIDGDVYIDNTILSKTNYTSRAGSTIITLNKEYSDTLTSGSHNIMIRTSSHELTTNFTIGSGNINNPQTSDRFMVYYALFTISLLSIITLCIGTSRYCRVNGN